MKQNKRQQDGRKLRKQRGFKPLKNCSGTTAIIRDTVPLGRLLVAAHKLAAKMRAAGLKPSVRLQRLNGQFVRHMRRITGWEASPYEGMTVDVGTKRTDRRSTRLSKRAYEYQCRLQAYKETRHTLEAPPFQWCRMRRDEELNDYELAEFGSALESLPSAMPQCWARQPRQRQQRQ